MIAKNVLYVSCDSISLILVIWSILKNHFLAYSVNEYGMKIRH